MVCNYNAGALQVASYKFQVSGFRAQVSGLRLQGSGYRFPAEGGSAFGGKPET